MKRYSNGFSNRKRIIIFMITILILGIITGIIYYYKLPNLTKNVLLENISNTILKSNISIMITHIIMLIIILISSFIIVGLPLSYFCLFYEGLSIGFNIIVLFTYKGVKGLIYSLIYNILYKFIFIAMFLIFIYKITSLTYNIFKLIILKDKNIKRTISNKLKSILLIILFIFIVDIINYFLNPYILNVFKNLLK
ncbi:MAG: hypothetical protein IJ574_04245 [Bacilli bacterium]|nr:hypothetical protein [Bacilli bacterium]